MPHLHPGQLGPGRGGVVVSETAPESAVEDIRVQIALRNSAAAQARYLDAQASRRRAVAGALDEGCSYREIAEAMRLSVSTVHNLRPHAPGRDQP